MKTKQKPEPKPILLSADELKFITQAVKYHRDCWGSMYAETEQELVKALLKKLPETP